MSGIYLFGVAARQAEWLSNRQTVIAENIANVDTPGYRAKDVQSFSETLAATRLEMVGGDRMHLAGGSGRASDTVENPSTTWDATHSGNTVSIEQELMKTGEITRDYGLNTSITKAFHRMLLTTLRS